MKVKNIVFGGFAMAVLMSAGVTSANAATITAIASKEYVDNTISKEIQSATEGMVTNESLESTLGDYAKTEDIEGKYATKEDLESVDVDLSGYQKLLTDENVTTTGTTGVLHSVTAESGEVAFVRSTITNDDIATDAKIDQSKVDGLTDLASSVGSLGSSVGTLEETVGNMTGEDGAINPETGALKEDVVSKGNLDDALTSEIEGKLDKNTADAAYQAQSGADSALGTATGEWKALEDSEKNALQSGITGALVSQITQNQTNIASLTTKVGTGSFEGFAPESTPADVVSAINQLQAALSLVTGADGVDKIASELADIRTKVGSGTLSTGEWSDIIAALNGLYAQVQTLSTNLDGKVDKQQSTNNGFLTTNESGQVTVSDKATMHCGSPRRVKKRFPSII